jgi:hypothetical protein
LFLSNPHSRGLSDTPSYFSSLNPPPLHFFHWLVGELFLRTVFDSIDSQNWITLHLVNRKKFLCHMQILIYKINPVITNNLTALNNLKERDRSMRRKYL